MKILHRLHRDGVIQTPKWLMNSVHLLVQMGSEAYAVSSNDSDIDVYGFCVPPRYITFPHENQVIIGFDKDYQKFDQWQQHHCVDKSSQKEYDFQLYNIVKYFRLLTDNNPNILDSLFVPRRCILHSTPLGEHVREHRKEFLHKGAYHKLKGYAYSQFSKIENKTNSSNPKRMLTIEEHGYDTKFAYHVVRLIAECQQILMEHDLDLERNREILKSIRRGEWTFERLEDYFHVQERTLEEMYANSTLREKPDEPRIKKLLFECLEMAYGSIDKVYSLDQTTNTLIDDIEKILKKYR